MLGAREFVDERLHDATPSFSSLSDDHLRALAEPTLTSSQMMIIVLGRKAQMIHEPHRLLQAGMDHGATDVSFASKSTVSSSVTRACDSAPR